MAIKNDAEVGDAKISVGSKSSISDEEKGLCLFCDFGVDNFSRLPDTEQVQLRCRGVSKTVLVRTDIQKLEDCPNFPFQGKVTVNKNPDISCVDKTVPVPYFKG